MSITSRTLLATGILSMATVPSFADYPVASHRYLADPSALIHDGCVYVCCSNDDENITGDRSQLEKDYPVLKGAAQFFLDALVEDPRTGYMVTSQSNSPENEHRHNVTNAAAPTMDNPILRDLFTAVSSASKKLVQTINSASKSGP